MTDVPENISGFAVYLTLTFLLDESWIKDYERESEFKALEDLLKEKKGGNQQPSGCFERCCKWGKRCWLFVLVTIMAFGEWLGTPSPH